ncbi:hypothetical protein GS481_02840 [Rhodococcus hoagii]|nr:hypothetical protein [Prescottella equi]
MPVSKKRKKKGSFVNKGSNGSGRRGFSTPTELPDSTDLMGERIFAMPAELLPTVGLGEFFLAQSPIRTLNQCHVASEVMMLALHSFNLPAEAIALELSVQTGQGALAHYGSPHPYVKGGTVHGHVGLIADDHFLDVTASQFPEIDAHGGVRVVAGPLRGQSDELLATGATMMMRLTDGAFVTYTAHPSGSADEVMQAETMAREEIEVLTSNLRLGYSYMLAQSPVLLDKVQSLTAQKYAGFVDAVTQMVGRTVSVDDRGRAMLVG